MRIKNLLLGATALFGFLGLGVSPVPVMTTSYTPPPRRSWGYSTRSHRSGLRYPYSGLREAERAERRLAFKAANGRWP